MENLKPNPFITFTEKDNNGVEQQYILQRNFPHYIGMLSSHPVNEVMTQIGIPGHYLWLAFRGTIRGNFIPSYSDEIENIKHVFVEMAQWFLNNRIIPEHQTYSKWQFKPHTTTSL